MLLPAGGLRQHYWVKHNSVSAGEMETYLYRWDKRTVNKLVMFAHLIMVQIRPILWPNGLEINV